VARLSRALADGPANPDYTLLITGSRGSGKTVLLNEAEDIALALGWRVISVSASIIDLSSRIAGAALEHLREMGDGRPARRISSVQVLGVGDSWENRSGPVPEPQHDELRGALTALAEKQAEHNAGLLLTVDELHGLRLADARELAVAVQHITRRELLPMAFVGAALPEIEETLLNDRGMTFFQRCARAPLLPLEHADTELALSRPISDAGKAIADKGLELMVEGSRGHPYTIQLLGYHSWEAAFKSQEATQVGVEHARMAVHEAEWTEVEQIVKPIWTGLSDTDRSFVLAMAHDTDTSTTADIADRLGQSTNYAQHYRRRLIDAGMIVPAGRGKVRFAHRATRRWLSTLGFDVATERSRSRGRRP
jgi:hypothetical protein